MELRGIDVSKWNGVIDWQKVAADGIAFAMIRAGVGASRGGFTLDKKLRDNILGAFDAGIDCGIYLYSYALTELAAKAEADRLIATLEPYRDKITWPVVYDIEHSSQGEKGRRTVNTAQAKAFLATVSSAGYTPMLYCNPAWAACYIDVNAVNADLWLAHYTYTPGKTSYKGAYTIHQYSDKGTVAGITGKVDMNIAYKDYAEKEDTEVIRYKYAYECPSWAQDTLKKLDRKKFLTGKGDDKGIDLSEDMLRTLVILDRAGVFGE